ncbi:MAG TPA: hypothetical protein VLF67_02475 [Candidatus Saccharimonas sp.]|nr:hypothetical protein [Candidatus Saccharimonas sp.]
MNGWILAGGAGSPEPVVTPVPLPPHYVLNWAILRPAIMIVVGVVLMLIVVGDRKSLGRAWTVVLLFGLLLVGGGVSSAIKAAGGLHVQEPVAAIHMIKTVDDACGTYAGLGKAPWEEYRACTHGWYNAHGYPAVQTVQREMSLRDFVGEHPQLGPVLAQCIWVAPRPGAASGSYAPYYPDEWLYPGDRVQPC